MGRSCEQARIDHLNTSRLLLMFSFFCSPCLFFSFPLLVSFFLYSSPSLPHFPLILPSLCTHFLSLTSSLSSHVFFHWFLWGVQLGGQEHAALDLSAGTGRCLVANQRSVSLYSTNVNECPVCLHLSRWTWHITYWITRKFCICPMQHYCKLISIHCFGEAYYATFHYKPIEVETCF